MIPRYFIVAERDHEIQNPTSEEKLRLLGERIRLGSGLARARHRLGPGRACARARARPSSCRIEGVEIAPEFHAAAVERAESRGLSHLVSFRLADASRDELGCDEYDAALCLGASFVLREPGRHGRGARAGGETRRPRRRRRAVLAPPPAARRLRGSRVTRGRRSTDTVTIFETSGLPVVSVIASSEDDWDRYETLHWRAVRGVARGEPERSRRRRDPYAGTSAAKRTYLRHGRDYLGWAIFIGWKPDGPS